MPHNHQAFLFPFGSHLVNLCDDGLNGIVGIEALALLTGPFERQGVSDHLRGLNGPGLGAVPDACDGHTGSPQKGRDLCDSQSALVGQRSLWIFRLALRLPMPDEVEGHVVTLI